MRLYALLLILMILAVGCAKQVENQPMEEVTGQYASELQKTACNAADNGGTCDTRLANLGFITKEECCAQFEKCC